MTIDTTVTSAAPLTDDRYASNESYTTLRGINREARHQLSESAWNYLWCGTADETTALRNTARFDELLWDVPLFMGIDNPRTETTVLGLDLSFPLLTAPFGQDAVFHPDGHLAVGQAVEQAGVAQMVPVAASFTLEEIAAASSSAALFQMTLVGSQEDAIELVGRAKLAGYRYIIATYSPIRQWRERLIDDRFNPRGLRENANFATDGTSSAPLRELLDFTEPRWTWADAKEFIRRSPLPVIIKGVHSVRDARESVEAGAAGLYVSNYGARTIDRTASTIEVLPEIREAVGPDVPIVLDSGIRRGSDVAAAIALGADAAAIGRLTALGLAANGALGVRRVLEILRVEFWTTMGHLGCSTVAELGPHVFRDRL